MQIRRTTIARGLVLLVCGLLTHRTVLAGSTADELTQIEAEHAVAKARLRLVETQAQIAARRADMERQGSSSPAELPTVAGIDGMVGHLNATLQYGNGLIIEVKAGDSLPNGMHVASVAADGVVLRTTTNGRVRLRPSGETSGGSTGSPPPRSAPFPYAAPPAPMMTLPPLAPAPQGTPVPSPPPRSAVSPGTAR
jgi:type IV pilus biogenesis protein PilP